MAWLKAFHIVFMVTWFAGLFYLPRLFVYHAGATDEISRDRFVVMERKLFIIMSIGASLTVLFGLVMLYQLAGVAAYFSQGWLHAKLGLVALLIGYHLYCWHLIGQLSKGITKSQAWYRWYNEVPALLLIAIVVLVVVRPF